MVVLTLVLEEDSYAKAERYHAARFRRSVLSVRGSRLS